MSSPITYIGNGVQTRFEVPGSITKVVQVNGGVVTPASSDFQSVTLSSAPAAGVPISIAYEGVLNLPASASGAIGPYADVGSLPSAGSYTAGQEAYLANGDVYQVLNGAWTKVVYGGGGGGTPAITSNVLLTLTTAIPPSSSYVTFSSAACNALRIKNDTGLSLEYQRNGTGNVGRIPPGTTKLILGITNASQVGIRRTDNAINGARIGSTVGAVVEATAIAGGVSATSAVPLTATASGAIFQTFANTDCTALDFFNDGEFDIVWRIDAGTTQLLRGGEGVVIFGITNANQISFRPSTSTGTNNFRAEALTGYTGSTSLTITTKALRIAADADIELTETRASFQNTAEGFATLGSLRTFRPLTKPGLRRLWLADVIANVTATGATAPTNSSAYIPFVGSTAVTCLLGAGNHTFTNPTAFAAANLTTGALHLTYKFPVITSAASGFVIDVFSGGSISGNFHQAVITALGSVFTNTVSSERWLTMSVGPNDWTAQGSGANLSAITNVRISLVRGASGNTFQLGAVDYVPNSRTKGALVFSFDGTHASQYDGIHKIFAKYGIVGCLALDPSSQTIGRSGFMTFAQLREMQIQGWQIMSQSYNKEREIDYTPAQWFREASKNRVLHAALGFTGGEDSSYWTATESMGSGFGERVHQFRKLYRTARRFDSAGAAATPGGAGKAFVVGETFPFGDPYNIRCLNMNSPAVAAGQNTIWQAHTQQAIDNKGVAVLACHNEGVNATFLSELDIFCGSYVVTQREAGNLDNVTFQQLVS